MCFSSNLDLYLKSRHSFHRASQPQAWLLWLALALVFLALVPRAQPSALTQTLVTLDPSKVDHTLPQAFWGVTRPPTYYEDAGRADYMNLLLALKPELLRLSVPPYDASLPTNMSEYWRGLLQIYGSLQQADGTKLHPVLYSSPQTPLPSSIDPWLASNVNDDPSDGRSPGGMVTWVEYLQQRFGHDSIAGIEPFNEPATLGGTELGDWYSPDSSSGRDPAVLAADWATVHLRQYTDALEAAGGDVATVPVYGASYSSGAGHFPWDLTAMTQTLDGTEPDTWPWPDSNLSHLDGLSFHAYADLVPDQTLFNSIFYPTFLLGDPNDPSTQKSGYLAAGNKWRQLLLDRGRPDLALAQTEEYPRFLDNVENNYKGALYDIGQMIVSVDEQKAWNLKTYLYQSAGRMTISSSQTPPQDVPTFDDGLMVFDNRPGSPTFGQFISGTVRYYALRDMIGPFVHDYKRQIPIGVSSGGTTPATAGDNAVRRIQVAAGLNAAGTKIGVLVGNFDLSQPEDVTFELGTVPSGPITGVYLPNSQGWSPLPSIAPINVSSTSFTRTIGAGEAYFFEIPVGGTLGRTSVGASTNQGWGDFIDLSGPYALASAGSVTKLSGYLRGGGASEQIRTVIYADDGTGNPGALIAVSTPTTIAAGQPAGWVDFSFTNTPILTAGSYWLGYWYSTRSALQYYTTATGGGRYRAAAYTPTSDPPASYGGGSAQNVSFSLYATLEADGVAPTSTSPPVVGGGLTVGSSLHADPGGWLGVPAPTAADFGYQWQRCDSGGASCTPIVGATGADYLLVGGDEGFTYRVAVTATTTSGSAVATSAATGIVQAAAAPANTVLPAISGGASATQGVPLTADNGSWNGSPTTFSYQWQQCDTSGASCNPIGGATAPTYTPLAGDVGKTLRVVVTATNASGSTPASSNATAVVQGPNTLGRTSVGASTNQGWGDFIDLSGPYALASAGSVTKMTGYVQGGSASGQIRAVIYADNAGQPGNFVAVSSPTTVAAGQAAGWVDFSFSGTPILGSGSYWLGYWYSTRSALEYYTQVSGGGRYKAVTYSSSSNPVANYAGGTSQNVSFSLYVTLGSAASAPTNTTLPAISGGASATQGVQLTADNGVWDGSPTGYTQKWQQCNSGGTGCVDISAATGPTYTPVAGDVGKTLRVVVTATNASGSTPASSNATATVQAAAPSTLGRTSVGASTNQGWGDFIDLSGPYALASAGSVTKMTGYVQGGSASEQIRAVIYADNAGQPGNFVAVSSPTTVAAGQAAGWVDFSFSGTPILGSGSYWLGYWYSTRSALEYYTQVSGGGRYKSVPYSSSSNPVANYAGGTSQNVSFSLYVTLGSASAPSNTTLPAITGGASATQGVQLTADIGVWDGSPTGYTKKWQQCNSGGTGCVDISGATGPTYTPVAGDVGKTLRVVVTATNASGSTPASSNATAVVQAAAAAPTNTTLPAISGGSGGGGAPVVGDT